jgi:transcriptional regulator with XRE-family HTH domain
MLTELTDLLAHITGGTCTQCSHTVEAWHPHNAWVRAFSPSDRSQSQPSPAETAVLRLSLGGELRAFRAAFGLSQWRLSAAAGTARSTVERLEVGGCRPSLSMLAGLVLAAGWTVDPAPAHEVQVDWVTRLAVTAGPHAVVDTLGGLRRRARRLSDARRAWRWRQERETRRLAKVEAAQRRALMAGVRVLARAQSPQAIQRAMSGLGW